jgi:hypothetical protein
MTNYYETNMQHILEDLKRIDLMIQLQVLKIRCKKEDVDGFQGLYVSDEEINAILDDTYPTTDEDQHIQTLIERIAELEQEIETKKVESLRRGITLTLPLLANIFGLTPFELDVILICLAPELDTKYERLYAYLHNDATKKQPSVDLIIKILNLVYNTKEEKLYARQYFDASAPLVKHHILRFIEAPEEGKKSLLTRFIKVDDRIVNYLLGFNLIDKNIEHFTELIRPQTDLDELQLPEEQKSKIEGLINRRALTNGTKCFLH